LCTDPPFSFSLRERAGVRVLLASPFLRERARLCTDPPFPLSLRERAGVRVSHCHQAKVIGLTM